MPDYFDRLLARYTPVPAASGTTRARPRLPGPFERVEALRTRPQEPDEPAALLPSTPGPVTGPVESVRYEREVRTDRHTVVRGEGRPSEEPARPASVAAEPTLPGPRLVTPTVPGPRPTAADSPRPAPRAAGREASDVPRPAAAGAPRATGPTPRAAAAPARPRGAPAGRGAALGGVGRRAPRPTERVVQVTIGRLEVSAAPPPGASRPATGRPDRGGRRAPALSLDDYLSRGETRD